MATSTSPVGCQRGGTSATNSRKGRDGKSGVPTHLGRVLHYCTMLTPSPAPHHTAFAHTAATPGTLTHYARRLCTRCMHHTI
eukprot:m.217788 g.217788  ORF g.217788 m.217788 type:complete len:82 (+) comp19139_c0_seq4:980-1225(+)